MMPDLDFDMPQNQASSIKVIGVGGGGSNAVNYMFHKGIRGVDFVVCNTDQQALDASPVPNKIQLGVSITEGLGAGADPEKGKIAAEENIEDVRAVLESGTKMVFINAGMGGGTGTGAAPVIARAAREMNILTVAIVTIPFVFEGKLRMIQAEEGIKELKEHVDSLIVINNNKLREIYGNLGFKSGFAKADEILATASRGIAEVITQKGHLNIDLNDAKTVLSNSGTALMGSGTASGEDRALKAVKGAIESPLLDNNHIRGAKKVLLLIVSGTEEVTFEEMGEISDFIQDQVMIEGSGPADIIMGVAEDADLESAVNVTVVATGFHEGKVVNPLTGAPEKVVHDLDTDKTINKSITEQPLSEPLVSKPESVRHVLDLEDHLEQLGTEVDDTQVESVDEVVESFSLLDEDVEGESKEIESNKEESSEQQVSMTFEFDFNATDQVHSTEDIVLDEQQVDSAEIDDEQVSFTMGSLNPDHDLPKEECIAVVEETVCEDQPKKVVATLHEDEFVAEDKEIAEPQFKGDSPFSIRVDEPITKLDSEEKIVHVLDIEDEITSSDDIDVSEIAHEADFQISESIQVVNESTSSTVQAENVARPEQAEKQLTEVLEDVAEESDSLAVEAVDKPLENESVKTTLSSHSDTIQEQIERAKKRKERLQKFNYRFRNNAVIQKVESEPAYKRQGVLLKEAAHSSEDKLSRLSVDIDEDGGIELKNKNSFLHDNVD